MPLTRFILLIGTVILAAALTIWVGVNFASSLPTTQPNWFIITPIALVVFLALRALIQRSDRDD